MKPGELDLTVLVALLNRMRAERGRLEREIQAVLYAALEMVAHSGGKDPEEQLGDTEAVKWLERIRKDEEEGR